jgi:hypothetical protein
MRAATLVSGHARAASDADRDAAETVWLPVDGDARATHAAAAGRRYCLATTIAPALAMFCAPTTPPDQPEVIDAEFASQEPPQTFDCP